MVSSFSTNYHLFILFSCREQTIRHFFGKNRQFQGRWWDPRSHELVFYLISLTRLQAHKHRKAAVIGQELMEKPISSHSGMYPLKPYRLPTCKPDSGLIAPHWHVHAGLGAESGQTRRRTTENPSSLRKPQWLSKQDFSVACARFELLEVPLPQPPKYWDCMPVPQCSDQSFSCLTVAFP